MKHTKLILAAILAAIIGAGNIANAGGHNVNKLDEDGWALVHHLTKQGELKFIKDFVRQGNMNLNLQTRDEKQTALHIAAKLGRDDIAEYLIKQGVELNAPERYGKTPLYYAAGHGHRKIAEMLIDAGANIQKQDVDGKTPLHIAAQEGKNLMVKLLVKKGAKQNWLANDRKTPLRLAAEHGRVNVARTLVKAGSEDRFLRAKHTNGRSALHMAARDNAPGLIRTMIGLEIWDVDERDDYGRTPLHVAGQNASLDAARALVAEGADLFAKSNSKQTPHAADYAVTHHGRQSKIGVYLRHESHKVWQRECKDRWTQFFGTIFCPDFNTITSK